ncbi:hypothetical protein H8356DRAFT_1330189 [Neocallimastix lanati (nom. inval.)]|nr:hypothetical protein H8356DRAFT_1330189 [Neocallimastix sp. JGI-2020a]
MLLNRVWIMNIGLIYLESIPNHNPTWDINDPIAMEEIQNMVLDMKNNKAPGPDAFFSESNLSHNQDASSDVYYSDCAKLEFGFYNINSKKRRSFSLMLNWYSVESTVAKSVDVEMIRHGFSPSDSFCNINTEIITCNDGCGVIIDEWQPALLVLSHNNHDKTTKYIFHFYRDQDIVVIFDTKINIELSSPEICFSQSLKVIYYSCKKIYHYDNFPHCLCTCLMYGAGSFTLFKYRNRVFILVLNLSCHYIVPYTGVISSTFWKASDLRSLINIHLETFHHFTNEKKITANELI